MKFRGLLVGGAVVASTFAMTSAATVAHAASTTTHPATTVSSTQGVVEAGIVPPLGKIVGTTPAVGTSCSEPDCNMGYHGGFIQSAPRVLLIFWGTKWKETRFIGARKYLTNLYRGLGVTSRDHWSTTMTQYRARNGHPSFGRSVLWNWYYSFAKVPRVVTPGDLVGLVKAEARAHRVGGVNIQVVIATQQGACFSDGFEGSCGHINSSGRYCGWHSATARGSVGGIPFTNLPYQLDAQGQCGAHFRGVGPALGGFSIVGGHEYAETVTDPFPLGGSAFAYIDLVDMQHQVSGGEIGDKCAWGGAEWRRNDPIGWIKLSSGNFYMQSLWSNTAHRCVM